MDVTWKNIFYVYVLISFLPYYRVTRSTSLYKSDSSLQFGTSDSHLSYFSTIVLALNTRICSEIHPRIFTCSHKHTHKQLRVQQKQSSFGERDTKPSVFCQHQSSPGSVCQSLKYCNTYCWMENTGLHHVAIPNWTF